MTATILAFPGTGRPAPRIDRVEDLPPGAKAIVLRQEGHEVVASMRPALTPRERQLRSNFPTAAEALKWARRMSIAYPALYRLIVDETGGAA